MAKRKYKRSNSVSGGKGRKRGRNATVSYRLKPQYVIMAIILIAVIVVGYFFYRSYKDKIKTDVIVDGDLSFHFMMLGNKYSGDSIYVKAGDTDILIDAGSKTTSVDAITDYLKDYVTDNVLEYVVVTHAHDDHYAGFLPADGIFNRFECGTIIDFPRTNNVGKTNYNKYVENRQKEIEAGATHYTALECYNEQNGAKRIFSLSDDVNMEILYQKFYENDSADENNYSVCLRFVHGDREFLFTGDLEKEGEKSLAEKNSLSQAELFKAGHHGSKTSSNDELLSVIRPKICVVCCSAGYNQYGAKEENVFPTQAFIDRISKYTDKVYVTTLGDPSFTDGADYLPMNGNVVVASGKDGVSVKCSASDVLLKDTLWFKNNRTAPLWN